MIPISRGAWTASSGSRTAAWADRGAGIRFLNLRGASTVEGGLPLYLDGKIVGAIGVSGMASDQDGVCAKAGDAPLKEHPAAAAVRPRRPAACARAPLRN